jgi:hypothetical protein
VAREDPACRTLQLMSGDEFQYWWWTNVARAEMASLITQMGLESCPTCGSNSSLNLLPWPAIVHVGGSGAKPAGQHGGNFLYMALVRCESCGYSMMFDSEKLTDKEQPPLWGGPGPPTD